jgi:hypothetical protein
MQINLQDGKEGFLQEGQAGVKSMVEEYVSLGIKT